jgi:LysR family hydrogen peroxide-inducible transcriptional activator
MPVRHRSPVLPRPPAPLEVEQLRRFFTVARTGGFTAAARRLGIAQPAVSRSIGALEDDLGKRLIERTSRRFVLTKAGERLLAECSMLFEHIEGIRKVVTDEEVDVHGALRLGASEQVAGWLLPRAIATLLARHPRLHPFVVVATTTELASRVASGDLDVGFSFTEPRVATVTTREIATFRFDMIVAKGRAGDPKTCETFIGSREVEDERERSFPVLSAWRARWPRARIRASTNSIAAHVALVRAGAGVSILPWFAVQEDVSAGRLVRATGMPEFDFPLLSFARKKTESAAVQAFLAALEESIRFTPGAGAILG